MIEALGLTASVIAIASLAWESSKSLHELIDRLKDAPEAISLLKVNLSQTQNALETLRDNLDTEKSVALDSLLQKIRLAEALEGSQELCDRFARKIEIYTKHSKEATFSKRDRFIVNFHESEINQFNSRLQDHRQVIILVTTSMNLIISKTLSTDLQQLSERFIRQEAELQAVSIQLNKNLSELQSLSLLSGANENIIIPTEDRKWSIDSLSRLLSVCQDSISATSEARPTKFNFGDSSTDNSRFFEGVAGRVQDNITQTHGNAVVTGGSTAARGQMDVETFKIMFGGHQ